MKFFTTCFLSLCATAGVLSATPVNTFTATLLNVGSPLLTDKNSAAVGPYTLKINGVSYAALCMDDSDTAILGTSYSAYETQVGTDLSKTYNPTFTTQYKEEAYLMSLILKPGADRIDIQDAAWSITDSSYKVSKTAATFVSLAASNYQTIDFSKFFIVSDVNKNDCGRQQEFLINQTASAASPEPATMLLMGGGLLVAGVARRKRMPKA
jgi:hypothetical protein